jgi:hypothetical protein
MIIWCKLIIVSLIFIGMISVRKNMEVNVHALSIELYADTQIKDKRTVLVLVFCIPPS